MSAIIFCDGFDNYTALPGKWDAVLVSHNAPAAPVIMAGTGRGGAGAVFFTGGVTAAIFNEPTAATIAKHVGAQTTLYVGLAFNWNPTPQTTGDDFTILQFIDAATCQCTLWIRPSGTLYFTRGSTSISSGGTSLGTASVPFPSNSFHYLEVQVVISATVGVLQLKLDQTTIINLTGINTKVSGNSSFDSVVMGPSSVIGLGIDNATSYSGYIDDVYMDTSGFNGDVRVNGQLPSGDGSTQNFANHEATWVLSTITRLQTTIVDSNSNLQRATAITGDFKTGTTAPTWATGVGVTTTDNHVTWTCLGAVSQYKLVNESDPDGDSSYVFSSTLNDISRYTYPAVTGSAVLAVVVWAYARKDDGGFRTIQAAIKSGATLGTSGTDKALGTNYQHTMLSSLTDPNTGAAWTLSAVNAAEFGIKITN
jgi:hypothetical protein